MTSGRGGRWQAVQYFSAKDGSDACSAPTHAVVRRSKTIHQGVGFRDGCGWKDMPGRRAARDPAAGNDRLTAMGWQWEFTGPLLTGPDHLPYAHREPINRDTFMEISPPPLAKPPKAVWPKSIGIVSIVFGIGGLFQGVMAPLSLFLTRQQMDTFVKQGADQGRVDEYLAQLTSQSYISLGIFVVLGLILLTGGILLMKQRRIASPLLQTWAILKILAGGFVLFRMMSLTTKQMAIIMEATQATASKGRPGGGGELEMVNQFTTYAMWAGLGFGFIWLAILPVFFIIWFNRRKVIDQMKNW